MGILDLLFSSKPCIGDLEIASTFADISSVILSHLWHRNQSTTLPKGSDSRVINQLCASDLFLGCKCSVLSELIEY